MGKSTIVLVVMALGFSISITLLILASVQESTGWYALFELMPLVMMPSMLMFCRQDSQDTDFWVQFACFMVAFSFISCIAMPIVFYLVGVMSVPAMGYALGSVSILFTSGAISGYLLKEDDD